MFSSKELATREIKSIMDQVIPEPSIELKDYCKPECYLLFVPCKEEIALMEENTAE